MDGNRKPQPVEVRVTVDNRRKADEVIRAALEHGLAASAQSTDVWAAWLEPGRHGPKMRSTGTQVLVMLRTTDALTEELVRAITRVHGNERPDIAAFPMMAVAG